jgi:hypothetical protein
MILRVPARARRLGRRSAANTLKAAGSASPAARPRQRNRERSTLPMKPSLLTAFCTGRGGGSVETFARGSDMKRRGNNGSCRAGERVHASARGMATSRNPKKTRLRGFL